MNVITLDPPTVEPVTLQDVYATLRLTPYGSPLSHPHDSMLERHIKTAREQVESDTNRSYVYQRLLLVTNGFPACGYIELLKPPVIEVRSVGYYDADGVLQTVDSDDYIVTDSFVPRLTFTSSFSTPQVHYGHTYNGIDDAVRIEYIAGYEPLGSPADYVANVPASIKDAILLGVRLLYDKLDPKERESIEYARAALLKRHKIYTFA